MVEGTCLENRRLGNWSVSSNLTASAKNNYHGTYKNIMTDVEPQNPIMAEVEQANVVRHVRGAVKKRVRGFFDFIREQGVIGLAIGFLLGGATSSTVSSFVNNIINPFIGLATGKVNLSDKSITLNGLTINYGAFLNSLLNLIVVAAVVYFIFKGLGLDRMDKKKE